MQSNLAEDVITAWVLHDDACRLIVNLAQRLFGDFRVVKVTNAMVADLVNLPLNIKFFLGKLSGDCNYIY